MHGCKKFVWLKSNTEYWHNKLLKNKERDILHYKQLVKEGWNVIVIWECEINVERLEQLVHEIRGEK